MKRVLIPFCVLAGILYVSVLTGREIGELSKADQPGNVITETVPVNEADEERSRKAFDTMMEVLTHKRCVNCHPSDDRPRQGEDSHVHLFNVQRGEDNHGVAALRCNSCHQPENNNLSGVPGAPEWSLAPKSMAWQGLSPQEIAASMLDRSRNGNRSVEDIMHHLTEHELVLWAFEPGINASGEAREVPPVSEEDYIAAVKEWVALGAKIPE